jgi:hypothetical protein
MTGEVWKWKVLLYTLFYEILGTVITGLLVGHISHVVG